MKVICMLAVLWWSTVSVVDATAREWTDTTGNYVLEAELIARSDTMVVLKRADHELVALPIEDLSAADRDYLNSNEAAETSSRSLVGAQTWTLRNGTKLTGRVVDFCDRDVTIQRRRGQIFVNDRRLQNLPELYQQLIPHFVSHFEQLERPDRRAFEAWVLRQRGQPRTFRLKGVVVELDDGNEYAVPFFMFSAEDERLLGAGWDEWQTAQRTDEHDVLEDVAFLLQSLAAERQRDQQVQHEIAQMNLQLQAVQAGVTSLWEVTLYPGPAQFGPPRWIVVPGRTSQEAAAAALTQWPGFALGPIRRVSRR
jgi:hypothetical protein